MSTAKNDLEVLTETELNALARLLPNLLCGEESAVMIFDSISHRTHDAGYAEISKSLRQIADEEAAHEALLDRLASLLPEPPDYVSLRMNARRFFVGLERPSISERLAQIAELDAGVCLVLGALINSSRLPRSNVLLSIMNKIRTDEAKHVKICRSAITRLGTSNQDICNIALVIRRRFVDLLVPVRNSFEDIGVDSSNLLLRIEKRSAGH